MKQSAFALLASSALTLSAGHALAQSTSPPKTAVTELPYQSVFENYRRMDDAKLGSWKSANDKVTEIGGWREYLKQVQEQKPSKSDTKSEIKK